MEKAQPLLLEFWERSKALGLAVAVHVLAAALIAVGTLDWEPFKPPTQITGMTIEAVMVDTQALQERRDAVIREAEAAQQRE
jgi:membrane protein involved in colicin uptake